MMAEEVQMRLAVEFLFWAECPSHETALARLREALALEGTPAELTIREVHTDDQAQAAQFPGSPTIRLSGQDIQPRGAGPPYSLTCRMYFHEDGRVTALPTLAELRAAVQSSHPAASVAAEVRP